MINLSTVAHSNVLGDIFLFVPSFRIVVNIVNQEMKLLQQCYYYSQIPNIVDGSTCMMLLLSCHDFNKSS